MSVAAGDDEGEGGEFQWRVRGAGIDERGVDVSLEVIDGDKGLVESEGHSFRVADAHEQCAGEAGTFCNRDGVNFARARLRRW